MSELINGTRKPLKGDDHHVSVTMAYEEVEELLLLFARVAVEQGWKPEEQFRAYRSTSIYFVLRVGATPCGGLHLVRGRAGGTLPCLTVWPELGLAMCADLAEIALLALDKSCRGAQRLFWPLCVEMWRYCHDTGITQLWAEVTPANLRRYRRLGWPLCVAGPLRLHWGEPCYPCCMSVQEIADTIQVKAQTSVTYQRILQQAFRKEETPSILTTQQQGSLV